MRSGSFQQPRQAHNIKQAKNDGLGSTQKNLPNKLNDINDLESVQIVPTTVQNSASSRKNQQEMERRSSYRKLKMLPWCKDERDEIMHTEYIKFLA